MYMGPVCTNVCVTNLTDSEFEDLKEKDTRALENLNLPIVVILSVVSTVGIPSNVILIIVWSTAHSLNCSVKHYVIAIAAYDLLACLVGIPADLMDLYFIVRTRDPYLCKLSKFILTVAHVGSMHGLLCIELDRYQHIVHPMKSKTIRQRRKLLLAVGFAVAVMVASPNLLFYGVHTMKPKNIPEYTCGVSDEHKTSVWPAVMKVLLITVFGAAWLAVVYMYYITIRTLWWHQCKLEGMRSALNTPDVNASDGSVGFVSVPCKVESVTQVCPELPSGTQSVCELPQDRGIRSDVDVSNNADTPLAENSIDPEVSSGVNVDGPPQDCGFRFGVDVRTSVDNALAKNRKDPPLTTSAYTASNRNLNISTIVVTAETPVPVLQFLGGASEEAACGRRWRDKRIRDDQSNRRPVAGMDRKAKRFRQTTVMVTVTVLTVTCVFFVSYCPYLVVLLLAASDGFFLTNVRCNEARYFAFHLLSRSYIMILALNPLIYSAASPPFRHQCKRLLETCQRSTD